MVFSYVLTIAIHCFIHNINFIFKTWRFMYIILWHKGTRHYIRKCIVKNERCV